MTAWINRIVLAIGISIFSLVLVAQQYNEGELSINADPRIDCLVQLHIAYNAEYPVIDGYRIHIFIKSGNEALTNAEEVKMEFEEKYEKIPAYITFGEPYYRVRVGDFRTRLEAEKFLQRISRTYPNAWVTSDKINLPVIPKYKNLDKYE